MIKCFNLLLFLIALSCGAVAKNSAISTHHIFSLDQQEDSVPKPKSFYEFKKAGKQIDKVSKMLVADSVSFSYGIQSYRKYPINGTTCFYNQPTDLLFYLLLAENNHAFHFEIPLVNMSEVKVIDGSPKFLEIRMDSASSIFVKEYTGKNGLLFSAGYPIVQIPISEKVSSKALLKQMTILKKKAAKFKNIK